MKTKLFMLMAAIAILCSCSDWTETENLQIQKPYAYSEQYYQNLRDYKSRPHQVFYGWFASYANREGQENEPEKESPSWGEHFAGLPDSMDFCSCWGGVPTPDKKPIAYREMRYVREKKGIKMLSVTICHIQKRTVNGEKPWANISSWSSEDQQQAIKDYADILLDEVFVTDENGVSYVDGLDLDYEPGSDWLKGANFTTFVMYIGSHIGPMAETEFGRSKYLTVDYYGDTPQAAIEPYINYLVRQSYTQGFSKHSDSRLQSGFNSVASWCPSRKYIVTENYGEFWATGGSPYEYFDNQGTVFRPDGKPMFSLEGMARWNPTQGPKGGIGGYYFERDYQHYPPYGFVRECIQIMNPAVVK